MRAHLAEAEARGHVAVGRGGDVDGAAGGLEAGAADALTLEVAVEHLGPRVGARVGEDVVLPGDVAAVGAVLAPAVGRVVGEAEFGVVESELGRVEEGFVGFPGAGDDAGAPAAVDQLPAARHAAVREVDGVPGVAGAEGGHRGAGGEGSVAVAFAVAADDEGLETAVGGEGGEEAGVAFADGEAALKRAGRRGGLDIVGEEGVDVVGDVIMEPGEDASRLVGWG